ncbi:MAG: ATP-binding cassette domain-containing protein [Desulfopila sp.]
MRIAHLNLANLTIDELTVQPGESWCFYGSGRSGINTFLALLEGKIDTAPATVLDLPESGQTISFSAQQEIFEEELRNDDSDFMDQPDPGTLAQDFLPAEALASPLIDALDMRATLTTGYRQLSSGQGRKLLLLQALLNGATTIVVDSPYEGLDPVACQEVDRAFSQLDRRELRILVLVRNFEDIPAWCDHLALFHESGLAHQGERETILPLAARYADTATSIFRDSPLADSLADQAAELGPQLIVLNDGFARYGEKNIFSHLDFSLDQGQHTLITGPNGCGKSTLLHIITGDNPKCYANDLTIFGRRRGTGESIWEIKRFMGIVSPEIHRNYRVPGSAQSVVLSGLFDSIGLYRPVSSPQKRTAARWLAALDMAEHLATPFRALSYGDQRLVLIARALIKQPPLLVLDEPTQGLDDSSRKALLDFLETVSRKGNTTILYVSHRRDEYRSFFRQHLQLEDYTARVPSP